MIEEWRDIEGYEGLYQVSNIGRVKSLPKKRGKIILKEHILKLHIHRDGYLEVILWKNSKMKHYKVHRLVAKAFIPNPHNLPEINHKDECRENNIVENLEYISHKDNCNYGTRNKRSAEHRSKPVFCVETNIIYPSTNKAAMATGLRQGNISLCCNGKINKTGGYHWKYAS